MNAECTEMVEEQFPKLRVSDSFALSPHGMAFTTAAADQAEPGLDARPDTSSPRRYRPLDSRCRV
jgi:hypothetical protein